MISLEKIIAFFFDKKNITYFIIITILWIFHDDFTDFFKKTIVDAILFKIQSDWKLDLFFIVLSIYLVCYFILYLYKKKHYLSYDTFLIIFIITYIYLYHRFYNNEQWDFYHFIFIESIKYTDIIILISLFTLCLPLYIWLCPNKLPEADSFFVYDDNLKDKKGDILDRKEPAKELAKKISTITNNENAFNIGIIAPWGSGKTSFLKMIEANLKQKHQIIVYYNPWYNSSPKTIIQDFFETLKKALKPYSSQLQSDITSYANKLTELNSSNSSKFFKELISIISDKGSTEEQYEHLRKSIKELNKQIIIFIDDLDRLDKPEIIEVIRLIRNTANFSNVIFVVAYDKNYVTNALKDITEYKAEIFLQKIFSLEIILPHINKNIIYEQLLYIRTFACLSSGLNGRRFELHFEKISE